MNNKTVLILGSTGLLGNTIYKFLRNTTNHSILGTSRSKKRYHLNTETFEKDVEIILKDHSKIDLVINCIAQTEKNSSVVKYIRINSLFPHQIYDFFKDRKTKIIHISTDAVYSDHIGHASELSQVSPETYYAASKLLGELSHENTLTIRTSFLGLSDSRKHGILDRARYTENKKVSAPQNQIWSGCTTLQLSRLCLDQLEKWGNGIKSKASIVNFAPLKELSRYQILTAAHKIGILKKGVVKFKANKEINRNLESINFDSNYLRGYNNQIDKALLELWDFHKNATKEKNRLRTRT